jgi:hypothetical protein
MENNEGLCFCGCEQKTNLAPYTEKSKGWVKGMPLRFIKGHQFRAGSALRTRRKPQQKSLQPYSPQWNTWLAAIQQEMRERMRLKGWKYFANAKFIQGLIGAAKIRKSKRKYYHKNLSAAACKSKVMRERREAIEQHKAARLAKRKAKIEAKRMRAEAKRRKLRDPIAESARIFKAGYDMGVRSITEGGQWIKKP